MRFNLKLFVIVAISAIFGAVVALRINSSEAQPDGGRESRFVLTGTLTTAGGARFFRYEDPEYNMVCYAGVTVFSCAKK